MSKEYAATADRLTDRIVALGPAILTITSPWDLFKIDGFDCKDIEPSLYQASFALSKAQAMLRERLPHA